uniref:Uncharacterized protein n=1 Tax=Photinus pyralis TaxID=7054 RepID=A0A1Y1KG73_PHOPY
MSDSKELPEKCLLGLSKRQLNRIIHNVAKKNCASHVAQAIVNNDEQRSIQLIANSCIDPDEERIDGYDSEGSFICMLDVSNNEDQEKFGINDDKRDNYQTLRPIRFKLYTEQNMQQSY